MSVPPVDREARRELARLVRHLAAGRRAPDEFEDSFPASDDPALFACWMALRPIGATASSRRYTGRRRLSASDRRVAARWVLFLLSDQPHDQPIRSELAEAAGIACWLAFNTLTLGIPQLIRSMEDRARGRIRCGSRLFYPKGPSPFASDFAFHRALQRPPFLCGAA